MISDLQLPALARHDLLPGDVLLCHSDGPMAALVASGGQGRYSHAALFCGVGDNVIESVPGPEHGSPGQVRETSVATFAANRTFVHVYRMRGAAQHSEFLQDVVHRARHYVGHAYGITQVLLNAYAVQRTLQQGKPLTEDLRREAAKLVHDLRLAERLPERIGITCSELVCQAFADARGPDGARRPLQCGPTRPERTRELLPPGRGFAADSLEADLLHLTARLAASQGRLRGEHAYRADGDDRAASWPIYMVSPGDLEHCPDLMAVGELAEDARNLMTQHIPVPVPASAPRAPRMTDFSIAQGGAMPSLDPSVMTTAPAGVQQAPPPSARAAENSRADSLPASACHARVRGSIVYVSATPAALETIAITDEINTIKDTIHRSRLRMTEQVTGATVSATSQAIERHRPRLLHFACHGSPEGLVLVNHDGGPNRLSGAAVVKLLQSARHRPQLVVLNACRSAELAVHLAPLVDHVIGMEGPISDRDAIRFATTLYKCLGDDKGVGTAFELAQHELGDTEARPVLLASPLRASRRRTRQALLAGAFITAAVGLVAVVRGTLGGASAEADTGIASAMDPVADVGVSAAAPAPAPRETARAESPVRVPSPTLVAPSIPDAGAQELRSRPRAPAADEPPSARAPRTMLPEAPRRQPRRSAALKRYDNADALKAAKRAGRLDEQAYLRELARLKRARDSALYEVRAKFNQGLIDKATYDRQLRAIHASYLGHEPRSR